MNEEKRDYVAETVKTFITGSDMEPTDPVKAISAYFEKNASADLKFRAAAQGKTAKTCWAFIEAVARKALGGRSGHIDPVVVYAIAKLLKKWHVHVEDYGRYLSECQRAGLDLRNEGTLYPPTKGGRDAFTARTEALEREGDRRERNERRREQRRLAKEECKRWERLEALAKERAPEIAAFQRSIDRTKTLTGCGYKLILAKSQDELVKEGKRMRNCVGIGTYGEGIILGNTLILTIQGRDKKARFCVEIERRSWTVRQCYGQHNSAAPDEVRNLAIRVAAELKAKAAEMRKAKKRRAA